MIRVVIFLLLVLFYLSNCTTIKKPNNSFADNLEIILEASDKDGYSSYMDIYLFTEKRESDSLVSFNVDALRRLYFGGHVKDVADKISFKEYIVEIINNGVNLDCSYYGECFLLDDKIKKEYERFGFEWFKKRYAYGDISEGRILINIDNLSKQEILTVIYFYYCNAYFTSWGDYEGFYIVKNDIVIEDSLIDPEVIIVE